MIELTGVVVRRAAPHESAAVLSVLDEAAADLAARGVEQWPPAFRREWIEPALDAGCVWLAEVAEAPVATLTLQWVDPLWSDDDDAGYLHRFAVRRHAAGLGARLLEWVAGAVREVGREWLRLDCVAANSALRAYYEQAGFRHVDDVPLPVSLSSVGRPLMSRYERRAVR
jgi:GNAT superfamily N-acetyltransferase